MDLAIADPVVERRPNEPVEEDVAGWTMGNLGRLYRLTMGLRPQINPFLLRPFSETDMRTGVPAGRTFSYGPDFVGVGTPKSGTSWWYQMLVEHPDVVPNRLRQKELHYFCHFEHRPVGAEQIRLYRSAFAKGAGQVAGEWSPGYLSHPFAVRNITKAVPRAKLIIIVRNPIDRTLSHLNQILSNKARYLASNPKRRQVYRVFSAFPEAVRASEVSIPLTMLRELVPDSQILILQYERCAAHPLEEIRRTYQYLCLEEAFVPPSLMKRVNQTPRGAPIPSSEDRNRLAEHFRLEVDRLSAMFPEIDTGLWNDF